MDITTKRTLRFILKKVGYFLLFHTILWVFLSKGKRNWIKNALASYIMIGIFLSIFFPATAMVWFSAGRVSMGHYD
jgi:hypothetical protein